MIPEVEAKLAKLNRGYEVTRERYLSLLERREATNLAHRAGQSTSEITFRIIEPPIVPYEPSAPNRLLLLTGVLLGSLASGLGWCLLRYQLRPAFMNLNELAAITGLPVLGSVSLYMSPEHITRRRMQLASFLSATFLLILVFGVVLRYQHLGVAFFVSLSKGF